MRNLASSRGVRSRFQHARVGGLRVALTIAMTLALLPLSSAWAGDKTGPTYRRNRGQIAWQQTAFGDFATEKEFGKAVAKARRNKVLARNARGNWEIHFIAFMRTAPKATKVNLVWYRLGKKREQVDFTEFTVPANEPTLQASAKLLSAQGFKVGDKLEGRVTRLIKGRETVYARCRLTLK